MRHQGQLDVQSSNSAVQGHWRKELMDKLYMAELQSCISAMIVLTVQLWWLNHETCQVSVPDSTTVCVCCYFF